MFFHFSFYSNIVQYIPLSMTCLNQNEIQNLTSWGLIVSTVVIQMFQKSIYGMLGKSLDYRGTTVGSYSRIGTYSTQGIHHLHLEIKCYRLSIPTLYPSLPVYSVKWVNLWIWSSCQILYKVNENRNFSKGNKIWKSKACHWLWS